MYMGVIPYYYSAVERLFGIPHVYGGDPITSPLVLV